MKKSGGESLLFKKVYGCLAGSAIGDAMGGATEMMHYKTIQRVFGEVTELLDHGKTRETARFSPGEPAGTYTDDTRLKHLLCEAIIAKGGRITAEDLAETWKKKMRGWFYVPVLNAYYKISSGEARPRDAGRGNMASNSSAMSISPIGIVNACDPRQAAQDAYDVAGLIHYNYALDAAACVATAVAEAFSPEATIESVIEAAVMYLDKESELIPYIERAMALARETGNYEDFRERFYEELLLSWPQAGVGSSVEEGPSEGFYDTAEPRETVPTALALFYLAEGKWKQSVVYAANFGRDSDTIGSIVGAIAGAYEGVDAITADWLNLVSRVNSVDQEELAHRMFQAVINNVARIEEHLALLKRLMV